MEMSTKIEREYRLGKLFECIDKLKKFVEENERHFEGIDEIRQVNEASIELIIEWFKEKDEVNELIEKVSEFIQELNEAKEESTCTRQEESIENLEEILTTFIESLEIDELDSGFVSSFKGAVSNLEIELENNNYKIKKRPKILTKNEQFLDALKRIKEAEKNGKTKFHEIQKKS